MYSAVAANKRKSVFLIAGFIGLICALVYIGSYLLNGDASFVPYALIGSLIYIVVSYYSASKLALTMNGAREVSKREEPRLYRTVENLAITTGMPMPKVYVIEDPGLNAFATGRDPDHAVVAATRGLLDTLDNKELEGVMAHELGHVKNYDIRVSMVAFALVAIVSVLADLILRMMFWGSFSDDDNNSSSGNGILMLVGIVLIVLSPIIAALIQLAISRQREYLADATSALTTKYPEGLESALQKIAAHGSVLKRQNSSTAHFFIANPLKGKTMASLFSTHPPVEDRIARLREMEGKL